MTEPRGAFSVEEHVHGGTVWVAIRARGAEWSWFTPDESGRIGADLAQRHATKEVKRELFLAIAETVLGAEKAAVVAQLVRANDPESLAQIGNALATQHTVVDINGARRRASGAAGYLQVIPKQ